MTRALRGLGIACLLLGGLLASGWGALALYYQSGWPTPWLYLLLGAWLLACWVSLALAWWRARLALLIQLGLYAALLIGWNLLQPSNQRAWTDDLARMTLGRVEGHELILDNVRDFDWRSDDDYRVRWETRRYDLQRLRSVDLLTSYWGMPAIAHVLVSFGFDDGRFLVFSVEIRKEKGERYSEIGGFFKRFELSIVAADERDALRVRTNVRGEDTYLYRLRLSESDRRSLLLAYVEQANALVQTPRFYHTVTANCTTIVFDMMQRIQGNLPLDYRLLLTGYLPGYAYDEGGLQPGYTLDTLTDRGRITLRAQQADADPAFSRLIRQGVPGWEEERDH